MNFRQIYDEKAPRLLIEKHFADQHLVDLHGLIL
jgi:hypothetical protein